MTTNHHSPYVDNTTTYKSADMNSPLSELDAAMGDYAGNQGKVARVNEAEGALEFFDTSYDVGGNYTGSPSASAVLMRFPFVRNVKFPTNLQNSRMIANVAATAETVFSIQKNGVEVFTATFAISGTVATFSGSETTFGVDDILTVVAPGSPDASLADLGWCFAGDRNIYTITATTTTTTTSSTTTTTTSSSTTTTTTA